MDGIVTALDLAAARRRLAARRQELGDSHEHVLLAMRDLANVLMLQPKLAAIRQSQEELLDKRREIIGYRRAPELSTNTLFARWLASEPHVQATRGRPLHETEGAVRTVLKAWGSVVSPTPVADLGPAVQAQLELSEVRTIQEQVLLGMRRVLGAHDLATLNAMNDLARTAWAQDDDETVRQIHEERLQRCRESLGDKHAETRNAMNALARTMRSQRDYESAETLLKEVVSTTNTVLGESHVDTLAAMSVNGHLFLPIRGHRFSPLMAMISPHWWPSNLPTIRAVGLIRSGA
jgi:Tetratricopeptide repeat